MSTTHGQPGLSSDQRSTIRSTILSTRHTLEDELRRQLEKYGIYEDKKLPLENLTHLSVEEIETRRTLDAAIERELESTEGDLERSITNYVHEATKAYLNRFVALKTIEIRGLIEETITERPEYGNRSYMHHTVAEIASELTNATDDGFGAALDLAYQEIGSEIRMIFEESEYTTIDLDSQLREEVLDELDAVDNEAWESDEALGWVYQYFGEEEREEIDERVDKENYKITGTDIATKTQRFTPRYIVEWMVDNSLGRIWLEMYGDQSRISDEDNCFFLSPHTDSLVEREKQSADEITVLDPACGSGHMLLYAFDILYEMYLEEGEIPENYIPREILRNNLYGIDIDSGAAQIAALSLYLKAKGKAPEVEIPQLNIVSADAVLINGDRKQEVLDRAQSPIEKEILEEIWESFDNIRELGSLVRVEEKINEIIEEKLESGQAKFGQGGSFTTGDAFVTSEGEKETWEDVKLRLLDDIRELASDALNSHSPVQEMFANEVGKTVHILDVLLRDYEVVLSNPPYLNSGKMNNELKEFLKENYKGYRDIYSSFIERNLELVADSGYVSMITLETFMFNYSYRSFRPWLLDSSKFVEAAHLDHRDEAYMNICFTLRKSEDNSLSRFYRLVNEENKPDSLREMVGALRENRSPHNIFTVDQTSFKSIDRTPFIYWFGNEILDVFSEYPSLSNIGEVLRGLDTGDDDEFVRYHWEITDKTEYYPYMMSGEGIPYIESPKPMVRWGENGDEIKNFDGSIVPSEDRYFNKGYTYRRYGDFAVREKPSRTIPSDNGPYIGIEESRDEDAILGYLNSSIVQFITQGINPGPTFQVGDAERIPIPDDLDPEISEMASTLKDTQTTLQQFEETSPLYTPNEILAATPAEILHKEELLSAKFDLLQGLVDEKSMESIGLSDDSIEWVYENTTEPPHYDLKSEQIQEIRSVEQGEVTDLSSSTEDIDVEIDDYKEKTVLEVAEELNASPQLISKIRFNQHSYDDDELESAAARHLSAIVGTWFGRWDKRELSIGDDGIVDLTEDVEEKIITTIEMTKKTDTDASEIYSILQRFLGRDPSEWIITRFFRYHHCKNYRRRGQRIPVYWQLESPQGAFTCFVFYHNIDQTTLPKLRGQYLDPRIDKLENELETLNNQTNGDNPDKELLNRKEKVQNDLDDLRGFRDTIDEMIDDSVTVDVEKGIWENLKEWDQYQVLETGLPKLKSSYSR